ncbi:serine/threonine protein kinase, putative [Talaromyces stipitatus ATCC 10500]|uniref:Serine/threonine protein kinase, putative n=1 Tax=Talaromyces stipitatus (strain ATCC 10500 / CBS 375.48 / QM 6759 / NRRL 1006) TaxID=441959 RepID=B8M9Z7_TALSN|nr:serine/threonine protein kinase, putative [Talaromyces stipitatus ATCC 10500]EED18149.1 serine/threonine protein kinase, putative [Talaromyces stipitatus ATCC 10500]
MTMLECVGKICRWDPLTKQATNPHSISAFQPLIVGRNRKTCQYVLHDACVSNQHLRIYTVIYDLENPLNIPPLVYAQDISTNGSFWNGQRIDKTNGGAVLLSDGDIIRLSSKSFLEYRSEYQSERPLDIVQQKEAKEFANEYLITDRLLGEGSFGQVRMAVNLCTTSQVACKVVNLRAVKEAVTGRNDLSGTDLLELQKREVSILEKLSHPNIIGVEKVFMMESSLYIFEDLITAGDLFTFVDSKSGNITDFDAASITQQILIAVDYLHDNNIVHRDLKPENILMTSHGFPRRVVLADFGCAQVVSSGIKRMSTVVGTWDYTAPEVYKEVSTCGYTKSVDLWSVGCITVVLLIGTPPFPFSASGNVEYNEPGDLNDVFMNTKWNEASTMAQNFVLSLLVLDERKRLTAKQALQHNWFSDAQYQSRLKECYEEAIRDWRPRSAIVPPGHKSRLQSVHKSSKTAPTSRLQHSQRELTNSPPGRRSVIESSREGNAGRASASGYKQSLYERAVHDKLCASPNSTSSQSFRRSFSPQAWKMTSESSSFTRSSNRRNFYIGRLRVPKSDILQARGLSMNTSAKLNDKIYGPTDNLEPAFRGLAGSKRSLGEALSQSPEIGEVYEEFENGITGKVQRILYTEK